MSSDPPSTTEQPPSSNPQNEETESADNETTKLTSEALKPGDVVTESLLVRLAKLEKYEHKLAEVARVYRNLNTARKAIEVVLKKLTPVQSIADVEELETHLSNLNMKTQFAGEQIGALTELDKVNRAKVSELEGQLAKLQSAEAERQSLAKELEKVSKERKVIEGQLERTNQKLKLDIGALESAKVELEAKLLEANKENEVLKTSVTEALDKSNAKMLGPDTLASQLSEHLVSQENKDLEQIQSIATLQKQLLDKLGIPDGFVRASELENSVRSLESYQQEAAQVKDIMRKEIAASEDRLKQATEEKDKVVAELNEQLKRHNKQALEDKERALSDANTSKGKIKHMEEQIEALKAENAAKPKAATHAPPSATENALTSERVNDIIKAAVAHRLVSALGKDPSQDTALNALPSSQQHVSAAGGSGGGKKKGAKKKRRGTQNSATSSPTPAAQSANADSTTEEATSLEVTKGEIDRLLKLVECIASEKQSQPTDDEPASENSRALSEEIEQLKGTIEGLTAKLSEAQISVESSQKEGEKQTDQLQLEISRLQDKLNAAETERDRIAQELASKTSEMDAAVEKLKQQHEETVTQSQVQKDKSDKRVNELEANLKDAQTSLESKTIELTDIKKQVEELLPLREQMKKAKADLAKCEAELLSLQEKLRTTEKSLTALHEENATLNKSADKNNEETSRLAHSLAKAQGINVRLEAQQRELQEQINKLAGERSQESKRADNLQGKLEKAEAEHAKALKTVDSKAAELSDCEQQLAKVQSTIANLEEHVRAVDSDLASSREQFAEKSRLLAQTTAQLQEAQYALEKERRASKGAIDSVTKELAAVREQLVETQRQAADKYADSQAEISRLQKQLGDLDQRASQASLVERLEAQQTEKEAELEALRSNMQRAEESQTALQIEVDRLRDIEQDFKSVKEQLERVAEERRISEQRWKRVHRDLKEEVRRLNREKQTSVLSLQASPVAPTSPSMPRQSVLQQQQQQAANAAAASGLLPSTSMIGGGGNAISTSSPSSRSNSMTLASVSSLLRAATGNAAAGGSGPATRRTSAHAASSANGGMANNSQARRNAPRLQSTTANGNNVEAGLAPEDGGPAADQHSKADGMSRHLRRGSGSTVNSSIESFGQDEHRTGMVNVEYLRNVLFRFFNDKERRAQLVPVLSMLLDCKTEDIKGIQFLLQ
ncbi:hypothetical protein GGI26_004158 [Coemansia sp. RSA 1358]|nr:hypothetical protein GGI26_004158 [Coemansia sp. RSA 1358]